MSTPTVTLKRASKGTPKSKRIILYRGFRYVQTRGVYYKCEKFGEDCQATGQMPDNSTNPWDFEPTDPVHDHAGCSAEDQSTFEHSLDHLRLENRNKWDSKISVTRINQVSNTHSTSYSLEIGTSGSQRSL
uniref:FLYWCH-type domain-containing protein n=1 Tax=Steinernema glaseri TaxID=37863 RepID=A0A1I7ZV67_9BILA